MTQQSSQKINQITKNKQFKHVRQTSQLPIIDVFFQKQKSKTNCEVENGLYQSLMYRRQKIITNIFNILLTLDSLFLVLYYSNDNDNTIFGRIWLPFSYCTHILNCITFILLIHLNYQSISYLHKYQFNTQLSIFKIIINFIMHPLPWWNHLVTDITYDDSTYINSTITVKINYFLIILALFKNIILIILKILVNTYYYGPRSRRIKQMYSVISVDPLFAFKCMFVDAPIKMVTGFFIIGFFFFSFAFKITQSQVPVQNNPFLYFENCIWFTFITISTVGYGDIRIYTHVGYIVDVCCMIWGTLVMSCILVVLINTLSINTKQLQSLTSLNRVQSQLQYRHLCKQYIRTALVRVWKNHKYKKNYRQPHIERKLRNKLKQIRTINRSYNPTTNLIQLCQRQFDNAIINAQYLYNNNIQFINFIGNHIFSEVLCHTNSYQSSKTLIDKSFDRSFDRSFDKSFQQNLYNQVQKQKQVQSMQKLPRMDVIRIQDLSSQDINSINETSRFN